MRLRTGIVAGLTVAALTLGLPALGEVVGIYRLHLGAVGDVYATVSGACGHVDVPDDDDVHYTFCFGDSIDARQSEGSEASVALVNFVMVEVGDCGEGCTSWFGRGPDVTYTVDPLLETATVSITLPDCGEVNLSLAATAEPDLRTAGSLVNPPFVAQNENHGSIESSGAGSASIGRDAQVTGIVCDEAASTDGLPSGRILRGLGSDGYRIGLGYTS